MAQISIHELLATCGVRCRRVVAASLASSHRCYTSVGGRACVRAHEQTHSREIPSSQHVTAALGLHRMDAFCARRTMCTGNEHEHTFHVTDFEDFQERVLNNTTPVIVDFHAE